MPQLIQRVPAGLLNLLNANGQDNPRELAPAVTGVLDLTQMYGLSQRQVQVANAPAITEGNVLAIALPNSWCVLYGAEVQCAKTATMTALFLSISLQRQNTGASMTVAADAFDPFGATETGTVRLPFWAPYPILMPPNSNVLCRPDIIGTDANVNLTLTVEIGVLG